jgi:uncharacterized membrane-anchored protein
MWLDNTLLILGIFGIMMGVMGLFARDSAQVYGIITFISMAMVGGWVFYVMYKYMYQYERPGADKSQRPKMWKIMLILIGSFFLWIATIAVTSILPSSINIVLDPIVLAVIGAVAIGLRYYLKKKYNIVGSLSVPRK